MAVRVFAGNSADPTAFIEIVKVVRNEFGLNKLVMVGDRGMITAARLDAVREHPYNTLGWITALRPRRSRSSSPRGAATELFDEQDLAEITHPTTPTNGWSPAITRSGQPNVPASEASCLTAPASCWPRSPARVAAGTLTGADRIGIAVGEVLNKYKVGKHFDVQITDTSLAITCRRDQTDAEAVLDGIYLLRTDQPTNQLSTADVVTSYKSLAHLERDSRHIKVDDIDLRPIYHRLEGRVKAHILICMLACYLVWHLHKAWAPLTFTDEDPPVRDNPVAPPTLPAGRTQGPPPARPGRQPLPQLR